MLRLKLSMATSQAVRGGVQWRGGEVTLVGERASERDDSGCVPASSLRRGHTSSLLFLRIHFDQSSLITRKREEERKWGRCKENTRHVTRGRPFARHSEPTFFTSKNEGDLTKERKKEQKGPQNGQREAGGSSERDRQGALCTSQAVFAPS